jgi:hypothetical protein
LILLVAGEGFEPSTFGLRAHELRHVFQCEQAGSIPQFLDVYLPQLLMSEKGMAPLEVDARQAADALLERLSPHLRKD